MTDDAMATQQPPTPSPDLKSLDRLVGSWKVTGGAQGQVTYEWMEGGFFLLQDVDLEQDGQRIKGIEIIGHERPFGAEPSQDIASRFYDSVGNTLDYVYELGGGHAHDLGRREGLSGLLQGHLQRRRRHRCRPLGVSRRRRVRVDDDQGQVAAGPSSPPGIATSAGRASPLGARPAGRQPSWVSTRRAGRWSRARETASTALSPPAAATTAHPCRRGRYACVARIAFMILPIPTASSAAMLSASG